jgi:hypothetical protein
MMSKSHGTSNVPATGFASGQVQPMPRAARVPGSGKSFPSIGTTPENITEHNIASERNNSI